MIRNHFNDPPRRRLAVVELPRPQRARLGHLGVIRDGAAFPSRDTAAAWTTTSPELPESSGNFMASVISAQNANSTTTPGTLTYTPAQSTPAPNVAPWNSWQQPNCLPPGIAIASGPNPQAAAMVPASSTSAWLILAGLVGGLAALKTLLD